MFNFKKGIGIESEKLWKQVREWKQVKDGAHGLLYVRRMKINSKAFAIPILIAI